MEGGNFLTDTRVLKFEQIVKFVRENGKKYCTIEDRQYILVSNCDQPPTKTRGIRFVCVGFEALRKCLKLFGCHGCFYSLRSGPGSACVKKIEKSTLKIVFCGQIGHKLVFYVEKT